EERRGQERVDPQRSSELARQGDSERRDEHKNQNGGLEMPVARELLVCPEEGGKERKERVIPRGMGSPPRLHVGKHTIPVQRDVEVPLPVVGREAFGEAIAHGRRSNVHRLPVRTKEEALVAVSEIRLDE